MIMALERNVSYASLSWSTCPNKYQQATIPGARYQEVPDILRGHAHDDRVALGQLAWRYFARLFANLFAAPVENSQIHGRTALLGAPIIRHGLALLQGR